MKKMLALLLCALLCLCAPMALAADYQLDGVLSFAYPDDMALDTEAYADETTETYLWLGMIYDDTYVIDLAAEYVDAYAGIYLGELSEEDYAALIQSELEEYEEYNASLLGEVVSDEGVPFYVLQMNDEGTAYALACTVLNGYVFEFDFSMRDGSDPDAGLEALLNDVLASFHTDWSSDAEEGCELAGLESDGGDEADSGDESDGDIPIER